MIILLLSLFALGSAPEDTEFGEVDTSVDPPENNDVWCGSSVFRPASSFAPGSNLYIVAPTIPSSWPPAFTHVPTHTDIVAAVNDARWTGTGNSLILVCPGNYSIGGTDYIHIDFPTRGLVGLAAQTW